MSFCLCVCLSLSLSLSLINRKGTTIISFNKERQFYSTFIFNNIVNQVCISFKAQMDVYATPVKGKFGKN